MDKIKVNFKLLNHDVFFGALAAKGFTAWADIFKEQFEKLGVEQKGISVPSIKNWKTGVQEPSLLVLIIMSKESKIDIENFFISEQQIDSLPNKEDLMLQLEQIKHTLSNNSEIPQDDTIQIREYEVKASAGKGVENYEVDFKNIPYSKTYLKNMLHISNFSNLCMCEVDGNSMIPTIPEEAKVFFYESENIEIQERKIYVVNYNGELYVKRVTTKPTLMFVSDNTSYPAIQVKENDFYRIVGRVVGYQPKLERI